MPELFEVAEEKNLRSALARRSALLQLVVASAPFELLGPAEAGRFMACLTKAVTAHYKSRMAARHQLVPQLITEDVELSMADTRRKHLSTLQQEHLHTRSKLVSL